jgi:hypothetical protein
MKSTENGRDIFMGTLGYTEVSRTDERLKGGLDTLNKIFMDKDSKRFLSK